MNQSQQLLDVTTNALLHLEFKKLEKTLSLAERNTLLIHFLKRIVKSNQYRGAKKPARQWLSLGRQSGADLETILVRHHESLLQTCSSDLYRFVDLIQKIEANLETKVQYSQAHRIDLNARYGRVLVCVVDEDLTSSFDEDGLMIKSTQMLFIGQSADKELFSQFVEESTYFQSVVAYEDEMHLRVELFRM
ncbi:DUF2913 family protein [Photobacterium damselae subsp. damselae]|uniref:DUF2913 family protein n=1 Tax=Photobacterium damselae TaxID=38293 RepID=UPI000A2FEF7D|nr:DUF2913 family protein [Photobacterium damselae]ARR51549.1 DUF2913 domain-containing protein [Photobacterium damselae subsp. damselae]QAY36671.1 DUF2913 family protein [Photobacterium damselae subsp. damselae]QOQ70745.1 DUF2913 family protein [Photobacterium damselae subsp. damselae]